MCFWKTQFWPSNFIEACFRMATEVARTAFKNGALVFLGDTRSRHELLVFAQASQARLPLAMSLVQPDIPACRMANDRKVQLTDAIVRAGSVLDASDGRDGGYPQSIPLADPFISTTMCDDLARATGAQDGKKRSIPLAARGDGHVLAVTIAMLLAIMTERSDLCIAGVFGAGKTRSLAVLLIALSCEAQILPQLFTLKRMRQRRRWLISYVTWPAHVGYGFLFCLFGFLVLFEKTSTLVCRCSTFEPPKRDTFFCSNALIALARSLEPPKRDTVYAA